MLSPDRAEFESKFSQVPERSKKNGHLPRWLLNPVFAARLTLAALIGLGAAAGADFIGSMNTKVSAATQCTGELTILGFRYFDRYPVDGTGKEGVIDKDDFVLESLPEQIVHLYDKDKKPFNPPKSAILKTERDKSYYPTFQITSADKVECDFTSGGKDAATLYLEFGTDKGNLHGLGMSNSGSTWLYEGIKEDNPVRLAEYLMGNQDVLKVGTKAQRIIGVQNFFASKQDMENDNPAVNKEVIRKLIAQNTNKDMGWGKIVMDGRRFATDWWGLAIALGVPLAYWYTILTAPALWDKAADRFYRYSYRNKLPELKSQLEDAAEEIANLKAEKIWFKQNISDENLRLSRSNNYLSTELSELKFELDRLRLRPKTAPQKSAQPTPGTSAKASQPGGSSVAEAERLKEELARDKSEIERFRSKYSPDWVTGQKAAATKWQKAKGKLPPVRPGNSGKEPEYVLARFKTGMDIVHEVALSDSAIEAPQMGVQVRAGIEYLIPEIWPDMRILTRFFDPNFYTGFWTPEDLAKIIYMPRQFHTQTIGSLSSDQINVMKRLNKVFRHALADDKEQTYRVEADPGLKDHISLLFKELSIAWGNRIEEHIKYR